MNILVFSWRDPKHPLAGGAEQVMHEHMKGWIKAGHEVTLFSSYLSNSSREEVIDGVKIIRRGCQYLGVQISAFFYYLKHRKEYDLVVDQFHGLPFFTPLFVYKPRMAVIQETAREVWFLNPLPFPFNFLAGLCGYLIEPLIFLFYKATPFMTGSESARKDVSRMGISLKNITVVPHGVVIESKPITSEKEKKWTVAYLGVLSKDKGIEDALKCFAILSENNNFQFWVIGRPETEKYKQRIGKLVKQLSLEKRVKFWGFVSQEKKFELLSRAHFLVNPSMKEGWGLVNIESNRMSTPVVAYNSAGLIDSVKDKISGILCVQNTPLSLAENILHLLKDQQKLQQLQRGALKWSQNFSWEESSRLSLKLVEEIRGVHLEKNMVVSKR